MCDLEHLGRCIRPFENVWVLDSHKYTKDTIKVGYAANLLQMNVTNKHRDRVK